MKAVLRAAVLACLCLALPACMAPQLPPPAAIADSTTLDEQRAIQAEAVYQAMAQTILAADRFGLIPASARPAIAKADLRAYAAVTAVRRAYAAGNAVDYEKAAGEADAAVKSALQAFKG